MVQGETGYLVAAGDDEHMAEHIVSLLTNAERARAMGEAGQRVVNEKFSCQKQVQNIESLYGELLKTSKPREVVSVNNVLN